MCCLAPTFLSRTHAFESLSIYLVYCSGFFTAQYTTKCVILLPSDIACTWKRDVITTHKLDHLRQKNIASTLFVRQLLVRRRWQQILYPWIGTHRWVGPFMRYVDSFCQNTLPFRPPWLKTLRPQKQMRVCIFEKKNGGEKKIKKSSVESNCKEEKKQPIHAQQQFR